MTFQIPYKNAILKKFVIGKQFTLTLVCFISCNIFGFGKAIKILPQEKRSISNKQSNLTPKAIRERTKKTQT